MTSSRSPIYILVLVLLAASACRRGDSPVRTSASLECIDEAGVFAADQAFEHGVVLLALARATGERSGAGQPLYANVATGERRAWKHTWATRRATPADLRVGRLVVAFDVQERGRFRAPRSCAEARSGGWFMARVLDVGTQDQGYVTVSGEAGGIAATGHIGAGVAAIDHLRVPLEDDSPAVEVGGEEDQHYLREGHWFVNRQAPRIRASWVSVGVAVTTPDADGRGGQFIVFPTGEILTAQQAWRTRPAVAGDLKPGVVAFWPDQFQETADILQGLESRPPRTRAEAFGAWVGYRLTPSERFRGDQVLLDSDRFYVQESAPVAALRVPR
jgi:hypothetical protein